VTPFLVGLAGGSGSGKTTAAEGLAAALPAGFCVVVPADAYYRDLGHLQLEARARCNFDEPAALDGERLARDLACLRRGESVLLPSYDFVTHTRLAQQVSVPARPVVLVEGILVLALPELHGLFDLRIFVDASEEVRLARRMARDVGERGRTRESVLVQFAAQTRPMHQLHVEPSRAHADLIVSGETTPVQSVAGITSVILRKLGPEDRA
jgi:uridine kinase